MHLLSINTLLVQFTRGKKFLKKTFIFSRAGPVIGQKQDRALASLVHFVMYKSHFIRRHQSDAKTKIHFFRLILHFYTYPDNRLPTALTKARNGGRILADKNIAQNKNKIKRWSNHSQKKKGTLGTQSIDHK